MRSERRHKFEILISLYLHKLKAETVILLKESAINQLQTRNYISSDYSYHLYMALIQSRDFIVQIIKKIIKCVISVNSIWISKFS